MKQNRVSHAYEVWDRLLADAASAGVPVEVTAMTDTLTRTQTATRWELHRVGPVAVGGA